MAVSSLYKMILSTAPMTCYVACTMCVTAIVCTNFLFECMCIHLDATVDCFFHTLAVSIVHVDLRCDEHDKG